MAHRRTNIAIDLVSSDDDDDDDLLLGRGSVFSRPFRGKSESGSSGGAGAGASSAEPSARRREGGAGGLLVAPSAAAPPSSDFTYYVTNWTTVGGNGAAAAAAGAPIHSTATPAAALAVTQTTPAPLLHVAHIGYVDFDYVSNMPRGSPGDAAIINRERDSPIPNVVEVLLESNREMIGVIDHDEARLLAPILDRCFPDRLRCRGVLVSTHSHPKVVRVHFEAHSAQRRLSKFELQPIERQINYFLRGRKTLVVQGAASLPAVGNPPPAHGAPGPPHYYATAAAAPVSGIENRPPAAGAAASLSSTEWAAMRARNVPSIGTPVGDWTCFFVGKGLKRSTISYPGDILELVPEPRRGNDTTEIRLIHSGKKLGHFRSSDAARLASVLAASGDRLQWTCTIARKGTAPSEGMKISFYSRDAPWAPKLQIILAQKLFGFVVAGAPAAAHGSGAQAGHEVRGHAAAKTPRAAHLESALMSMLGASTLELSEKDWLEQKDALDDMFDEQSRSQLANLPEYPMPALLARKKVKLFSHQVAGIRWLVHQEQLDLPSYVECQMRNGRETWLCKITQTRFKQKPEGMKGGILADDMGLGKTLQTLGLILANPPDGVSYPRRGLSLGSSRDEVPVCTLIVSPLTVIGNWYQQIFNHVNGRVDNKNITIAKYHGPARENVLLRVQKGQIDVLMTSYHTLASDFKNWIEATDSDEEGDEQKAPSRRSAKKRRLAPHIFDMDFHRIVLDEAHIVRNSQASLWKAVMSLQAERKLCLTGTPFVNNPSDIHSLLNFLNVQPLCLPHVFSRMVSDPIKEHLEIGLKTVRATMAHVALRRKKEGLMDEIQLVSKTVQTFRIGFIKNSEHYQVYELLYESARSYFLDLLNSDDKKAASRSLMQMLALVLRIRQCCCHLGIINKDFLEHAREHLREAGEGGEVAATLNAEEGKRLLSFLSGAFKTSKVVECAVCMEDMEEENAIILRKCQHIFCEPCLNRIENGLCPMCRADYSPADMVTKQAASTAASEPFSATDCLEKHGRSPKIQALMNLIDQMAPGEKGVIFSQWTSVLKIIEAEFIQCGHTFDVIRGDKTADERTDAMLRFDTERCDSAETPRFMLCSLMACGTGINLTRANVVFMMDTWWNQAAENQAMDRVHRIGQTREVRVYRLVMKDSIEERMINLQQNKLMLAKGSMDKFDSDEEKKQARLTALTDLFQVQVDDSVWL